MAHLLMGDGASIGHPASRGNASAHRLCVSLRSHCYLPTHHYTPGIFEYTCARGDRSEAPGVCSQSDASPSHPQIRTEEWMHIRPVCEGWNAAARYCAAFFDCRTRQALSSKAHSPTLPTT